ncbi:trypsin-like serine protease [Mucilaginibacter terrae]|uniref:trypsin-like serine protease n=1 Tax=Mucilaginibacter terrae TaxID=1955052 RepID=UPI00362F0E5E
MKPAYLLLIALLLFTGCSGQEKVSLKKFDNVTLLNKIAFNEAKYDQPKFSCGFILQYHNQNFAVTAKHLLKIIKTDEMKSIAIGNSIKSWSMFALDQPNEQLITDKLLNENNAELIAGKATYDNDWLVFSIKENHTQVKPLQVREAPLKTGEKLYVIGWTRKMETGGQQVYEFEYYKTIGNRILLKEVIVPEQFGGLSGAPLVDEQGMLVGLVSNGTVDPETGKKYFSPCKVDGLIAFLDKH